MEKGVILCYRKIKSGSERRTRKGKVMFTIISKFYLNSEFKHEALHAHKQSYDAVRLDQMKHYWDLCKKRQGVVEEL